jgi:hypothetical protein
MDSANRDPGNKPVPEPKDLDDLFDRIDQERKERRAKGKLQSVYIPFQKPRKVTLDDIKDRYSELRLPHAKLRLGDNLRIYDMLTLTIWELVDNDDMKMAMDEDVVRRCDVAMRSMLYEPKEERTVKRPGKLMMTLIDDALFSCHIHTGAYFSDDYGGVLTASLLIRRVGKDKAAVGTIVMRVITENWPPKPPEENAPVPAADTDPGPEQRADVMRDQRSAGIDKKLLDCDAVLSNFFFEVRPVSFDIETRAIGL